MYHKRGLWAIKDKNGGSFPVHDKAAVAEVAAVRAPKFYPADDVPKPLHKNKVINPPKLRQVVLPSAVKCFGPVEDEQTRPPCLLSPSC
jgi:large subunit ribosomal protein L6e